MPASAEFGGLDGVIREAMVGEGAPRSPRLGAFLRVSYGSLAGRSLAGVGIILGGSFLVIELLAARDDPGHLAFAAFAALFTLALVAVPALPARRAWAAVRNGIPAEAVVTDVEYRGPGDPSTIDSIKNGIARGHFRLTSGQHVAVHEFESDAVWAGELRVETRLLVVVDRNDGRLLANLGPLAGTIPRR